MGIGVFQNHTSIQYTEIMKKFAQEQKLYLIIASTDYIYGTNYQFCHGYIGKDLHYLSHEKLVQALGRIGRNQNKKIYTARFRSDELINRLFLPDDNKIEANNLCKLLS